MRILLLAGVWGAKEKGAEKCVDPFALLVHISKTKVAYIKVGKKGHLHIFWGSLKCSQIHLLISEAKRIHCFKSLALVTSHRRRRHTHSNSFNMIAIKRRNSSGTASKINFLLTLNTSLSKQETSRSTSAHTTSS